MFKNTITFFLFFSYLLLFSQKVSTPKLGNIDKKELQMRFYEKDSSAYAVVLDEYSHSYPVRSKKYYYKKDYYVKIKILNRQAFELAIVELPYFKSGNILNLEGVTYNLNEEGEIEKKYLDKENIRKTRYNKNIIIKSFALPKVKVGSVIEYKYTIATNSYGVYDHYFQSQYPKVKTTYITDFSNKGIYNVRRIGFLKPDIYESEIKEKCLGFKTCKSLKYVFKDVPAFIEEDYMTSKDNFISRLSFEKVFITNSIARTNEWDALDKAFEVTYNDRLNKEGFFKKNLPKPILEEKKDLLKAKKVYKYILDEFVLDNTSNEYFYKALKKKKGTSGQLNLALYNALKASGLDNVNLMFLSTRKNGYITKLHPTIESFNYRIVRLKINNQIYYLDASQKYAPFGLIPFMCLSGEARVFDFENGSVWETPFSTENTYRKFKTQIKLNNDNTLSAKLKLIYKGYNALDRRLVIKNLNRNKVIESFEEKNPFTEVLDYKNKNLDNIESPFSEEFSLQITDALEDDKFLSLSKLFLHLKYKENPFKLRERLYPVHFGYPRTDTFIISVEIPKEYKIKSIPESMILSLQDKCSFVLKIEEKNNVITVFSQFKINEIKYSSEDYKNLKDFFNQIINKQNTILEIEKR